MITDGNHEKNHNQFGQHRDLNSELPEYEYNVMNFDRCYALFIQKLYHRSHFTVGGSWNKNLHFEPLQRCYCEKSGSKHARNGFGNIKKIVLAGVPDSPTRSTHHSSDCYETFTSCSKHARGGFGNLKN